MAKYINKYSTIEDYNNDVTNLNLPSINYIVSEDTLKWTRELPPYKVLVTNTDGSTALYVPFDSGDTVLHRSEFVNFSVYQDYGDFMIGEGVTGADDSLFFSSFPWGQTVFNVERLFIPSTFDNRNFNGNEYVYCGTFVNPFGAVTRSSPYLACGINPSEVFIADGAQIWSLFAYTPIASIDLSNYDYVGKNFGNAFLNATNLQDVTLPSGITSIDCSEFQGCSSLTSIDIPDSVTSIGEYAFNSCGSLTSIDIPDSVTSIGNSAFNSCGSLTSIDIPDSVTAISDGAFGNCYVLTSVTISSGVTTIGSYVFNNCRSLTSITIPNNVTTIGGNAFYDCTSLSSITIPDSVTTIGANAFAYCSSLQSITVNATTPPTLGINAFNMTNNCPIYVPLESVETYKATYGWILYADRIQAIS